MFTFRYNISIQCRASVPLFQKFAWSRPRHGRRAPFCSTRQPDRPMRRIASRRWTMEARRSSMVCASPTIAHIFLLLFTDVGDSGMAAATPPLPLTLNWRFCFSFALSDFGSDDSWLTWIHFFQGVTVSCVTWILTLYETSFETTDSYILNTNLLLYKQHEWIKSKSSFKSKWCFCCILWKQQLQYW